MVYKGMHDDDSEFNVKKYGALEGAKKILGGYEKHQSEEERIEYEKIKLYEDSDRQEDGTLSYHSGDEANDDEKAENQEDGIIEKITDKYDKSKDEVEEVMEHEPVAMPEEVFQEDEPSKPGDVKLNEIEELISELEGKEGKKKKAKDKDAEDE